MLKKFLFLLAIILCLGTDSSEDSPNFRSFDFLRIKATAEDSVRTFNPGFVSAFYKARVYAIHNYKMCDTLTTDTLPIIRTVAGYLPDNRSAGRLHVSFIVESKAHGGFVDTVYQYLMDSPLYTRRENGMEQELFQVKEGSFLVPLPPNQNITKIVLEDENGEKFESKFR